MALRWWGGRTQGGRHSADPGNGLPLVARLAGEELGRASRDKVEIGDRQVAMDRFVELCRGFGVVLDPATDGLDQLVRYVYQPLRDACFLTAKLLEEEVMDHLALGVPPAPAAARPRTPVPSASGRCACTSAGSASTPARSTSWAQGAPRSCG